MKLAVGLRFFPNSVRLGTGLALLIAGCVYAQMQKPGQVYSPGPSKDLGDKDYLEGMKVWRQPDANGLACAFCHTPDGLEVASYNFDDENLRRRATPHLGEEGAKKIVAFMHAVRKRYGIKTLLDPMKDRPLQPGGEVLPGGTPAERDLAFAKELETALPTLAAGKVDSLESALRAKDELLALDPRKLRIGIPFNRISEDGFHGMEHATFANWIADTALRFHFPWEVYFVLQDSYLRDPTDRNLLLIVEFPKLHQEKEYARYAQLMTNDKYRALLVYQHILRSGFAGGSALDQVGPVLLGKLGKAGLPNPLLDLGVFADERNDTPFSQFSFPDDTLAKKEKGVTEADQMRQIRLPSLYAGWLMDQGLMRCETCPAPRATRIFTERLLTDGPYPMHDAFAITKKLVTDGFAPEAWNGSEPQHFVIDYSAFLDRGNFEKFEPKDPEGRAIYRRFVGNSFRMSLFLYEDQESRGKAAFVDDPSAAQIPILTAYLKNAGAGG